ncbi:MAG: aminotransferase class I/II-fold pyridoxal phosphate-dependent enzyme, partial [Clostridia bacterium]|nr:aminotransferase class I/II-fold pyridoxal phosphate-dependent enzyme [Clostridia bacterium]
MIRFDSDYTEGAHPAILARLCETNLTQTPGYGEDEICESAREKIRRAIGCPQAAVHFLVGGTQANATVIAFLLRAHQGVICAETGHINVHETGAVEATGHRPLALPPAEGKISAAQVEAYLQAHYSQDGPEHTIQPGMVYISHPTECGTLYSLAELTALSETCRKWKIPLFLDGARLGYGLAAGDVKLPDLARLCDVFYIGGTKCGALLGEAVVFPDPALQKDFRYHIKQRGAMLAKGRLLGLQFDALFTDGLYERVCAGAVAQARRVAEAFKQRGVDFLIASPT